jgi:uncharacterized membrane protein
VALVLVTCLLARAVSPLQDSTPEIVARTRPNLMDLLIAFFAGLAGTYTLLVRKGLSTIPGVAIATAVMPPLCVTAFGLYHRSWEIAAGAFFLFFTNLVAIIVSAAFMFALAHFRTSDEYGEPMKFDAHRRLLISAGVLFFISMPLLYSLVKTAHETGERKSIGVELRKELELSPNARLQEGWQMQQDQDGRLTLSAVLMTPELVDQTKVTEAEKMLEKRLNRPVALQLSQILTRSGGVRESIASAFSPAIAPPAAVVVPPPPTPASNVDNLKDWIGTKTDEIETLLGCKISEYELILPGLKKPPVLVLVIKTDDPSIDINVRAVERLLRKRWQEGGIPVAKTDTILKTVLLPLSTPYVKVTFSENEIKVSQEARKLVARYVQLCKVSVQLRPVLLNPKNARRQWFELMRKKALRAALAEYGLTDAQNIPMEESALLNENEYALDFRPQKGGTLLPD